MNAPSTSSKLLRIGEAAEQLALAEKTLRNWVGMRRVETVRIGRAVRIPQSEVLRLTREGRVPRLESR